MWKTQHKISVDIGGYTDIIYIAGLLVGVDVAAAWWWPVIAKFHRTDTDTDTDFLADFRARILARKLACPARAAAGRSAALAARSARRLVSPTFVRTRAFPREDVRWEMRTFTRVRVLYVINYCVHVYKITR